VNRAEGLSPSDAADRLAAWGPNRLDEPPPRSPWLLFLDQFRNLLVLILIGAAVVAYLVSGELKDPIVIGVVVILNAVLGFAQERRAEASLAALKRMLVATARVRRDGRVAEIPAEEVVAGDIVLLEAGDRVPADGRWLTSVELEVDEASFTGESSPVAKDSTALASPGTVLAELRSMGFMNTTVTRGRGELVVTATGMETQIGQIAEMLATTDSEPSPLEHQIHVLARRLTLVAGAAVAAVLLLGLAQGQPLEDQLLSAVALAVAAIPEGLPAVLTITLAVGTRQLARRHAIVKRLASVETLGCTSVICTDKTGTLTLNQMTARAAWVGGRDIQPSTPAPADSPSEALLRSVMLCNDSRFDGERLLGDPTETALMELGRTAGLDEETLALRWTRIGEIPFDSTRKMMVTAHRDRDQDRVRISVKGAPDVLMAHCRALLGPDAQVNPLDDEAHALIEQAQERFAGRGLRVIGAASREVDGGRFEAAGLEALVDDLVLEGLVGIMDPPRPEARDAIRLCHRAGISVKMITGDHATTAAAIGRELGLDGEVVTGSDLDEMDEVALAARVENIAVFARVAPSHKVQIVRALRDHGHVVAMTGDGVNDAPALKAADIGVAMGITGTEVSKEAATMVLTDDNFATIVEAVRGGRSIYDNIVKFVRFQLSTNMGAIIAILTTSVLALPASGGPFFSPLALLWVNLIMDGPPAMALGVDPPSPGTMDRSPRDPTASILGIRRFAIVLTAGVVMAVGTIGVYLYAAGGFDTLGPYETARASTMAFTTFVLFQMFNLFNARSDRASSLGHHALKNSKLWMALAVVVLLQVLVVHVPDLQQLFTKEDVSATVSPLDWVVMIAAASTVLLVEEVRKAVVRSNTAATG
jgi:Ca2+-transporting ATPase